MLRGDEAPDYSCTANIMHIICLKRTRANLPALHKFAVDHRLAQPAYFKTVCCADFRPQAAVRLLEINDLPVVPWRTAGDTLKELREKGLRGEIQLDADFIDRHFREHLSVPVCVFFSISLEMIIFVSQICRL